MNNYLKVNYGVLCFFAFLTGSDFAIVIPTLWDRLNTDYKASGAYMGLVLSVYSLSGVVSGLIIGSLSDRTNKTKIFFVFSIIITIIGHLLYFLGINKHIILASRALSGLGNGSLSIAYAFVAKTTNMKQRTSIISLIMAMRQLGLMIGPAFNIFLRIINTTVNIGGFYLTIDRKTSPGLLLAVLWLVCLILILIFYKEAQDSQNGPNVNEVYSLENENITNENRTKNKGQLKKEFLRFEIIVLLSISAFTYFNQTSLETIVTPLTELMFGWDELKNSILFCICGLIIILSYFVIRFLTYKIHDRTIILCGMALICLALVVALAVLPLAIKSKLEEKNTRTLVNISSEFKYNEEIVNNSSVTTFDSSSITATPKLTTKSHRSFYNNELSDKYFYAFIIFILLSLMGLPAISICGASLFTKLVDNKVQGFGQGIQRGLIGIASTLGPLSTGPFIYDPIYIIGLTLSIILIIFILTLVCFKRLVPVQYELVKTT